MFEDVSRDVGDFEEASKGCPMTKGENGTMYNGRGLGRKGAGAGWRSSAGFEESLKVFKAISKALKRF